MYLLLLIFFLVFLGGIFVLAYTKKLARANHILAHRTMEVVAKDAILDEFPLLPEPKDTNDDLISQLDKLIRAEKVYLDPNLSLVNLSQKLNTNRTHLSHIINERYNVGFNDYINELRVKEICRLLLVTNDKNITIDHILTNSGFSSKSPFYSAFRKFTGVIPDVYKRMI